MSSLLLHFSCRLVPAFKSGRRREREQREFLSGLKEEEESNDVFTVGREETDGHRCCQTVSVVHLISVFMRFSVSSEVLLIVERGRERGREKERERDRKRERERPRP